MDETHSDTVTRWERLGRRASAHALAVQCGLVLSAASLRIAITPRRRLVAMLGTPLAAVPPPRPGELAAALEGASTEQLAALRTGARVGRMVARVAGLLPWHPTCLRQSMATRWLLRRRGVPCILHLGVADAASMDAHAWVTVDGFTVVGRQARAFAPVASFPA